MSVPPPPQKDLSPPCDYPLHAHKIDANVMQEVNKPFMIELVISKEHLSSLFWEQKRPVFSKTMQSKGAPRADSRAACEPACTAFTGDNYRGY